MNEWFIDIYWYLLTFILFIDAGTYFWAGGKFTYYLKRFNGTEWEKPLGAGYYNPSGPLYSIFFRGGMGFAGGNGFVAFTYYNGFGPGAESAPTVRKQNKNENK